jgi:hypothetical protein
LKTIRDFDLAVLSRSPGQQPHRGHCLSHLHRHFGSRELKLIAHKQLIAYAKANPGKLNVASSGNGTMSHMAYELFKMMTGANMVHVPFRGEAPAIADLIAGNVQVMFGSGPVALHTALAKIKLGARRAADTNNMVSV